MSLFAILVFVIIGCIMFVFNSNKNKKNKNDNIQLMQENSPNYLRKELMTDVEKIFYAKLKEIINEDFIVQPQVNLASIINKESNGKYRNELFRNIDFGVFKKGDYALRVLIELNDSSHNDYKRKERDAKIKSICSQADIPIIVFWLNMPNKKEYIENQLKPYLD